MEYVVYCNVGSAEKRSGSAKNLSLPTTYAVFCPKKHNIYGVPVTYPPFCRGANVELLLG